MNRVDVLLPIRLPAPWLDATLFSLKAQTFTDWQLIAAIHGGDIAAREKVRSHFPKALLVDAPSEGNLASTLNAGLRATSSTYIARIDQDDIASPERFEVQAKFLDCNPAMVAVGSGATLIGAHDETLGYRRQIEEPRKLLKRLRWKSSLIHPSVMFRREAVESVGGYSEVATNVEDYELWLRLAAIGCLGGINQPLIKYRIHPHQITSFRVIPCSAMDQVKYSRNQLAVSEEKSIMISNLRHFVWRVRQYPRTLRRRRSKSS